MDRHGKMFSQYNGLKSITMNEKQTNDLQYAMNLSHGQMDVLQSNVRGTVNKILLSNRKKMIDYRKQFGFISAAVHKALMEIVNHLHQKRTEMPMQECSIYHCCKLEAVEMLIEAAIARSKFEIPQPLNQSAIVVEIGFDKSSAGLVESVAAGVTSKYHGKYGSIVTTLAPDKVKESYHNYRTLAVN